VQVQVAVRAAVLALAAHRAAEERVDASKRGSGSYSLR
jgi:hypothetical protein